MEIGAIIGLGMLVIGAVIILYDQWKIGRDIRGVEEGMESLSWRLQRLEKAVGSNGGPSVLFGGPRRIGAELDALKASDESKALETSERLDALMKELGYHFQHGEKFIVVKDV